MGAGAPEGTPESSAEDDLAGVVSPSPIDRVKKLLAPAIARGTELSKQNRFFLPVLGIASAATLLFLMAATVKACSSDKPSTLAVSKPSASSSSGASPLSSALGSASSTAAPLPVPSIPPPAPTPHVSCKVTGSVVPLAEKTSLSVGVEVLARDGLVAVGYASSPKEGQLLRLGEGYAPSAAGHLKMGENVRRVQPLVRKGKLELAVEIDKKILGMSSRRSVPFDPPFDIGVVGATIAHAPRLRTGEKELFAVPGEGPIEALRVAPTWGSEKGVAVAFRHAGAVYVGTATGDDLSPKGELQKAQGLGDKVGSPAVAVSDDRWLAVFADRTGEGPWSLRLIGAKVGDAAFAAKSFTLPKGGPGGSAISPSLVPLGASSFLLAWTEGPEKAHVVRAQVLDSAGEPVGEPLEVSAPGSDAGQARGAVDSNGKGILAYFASSAEEYHLVAAPIACGKGTE